MRIICDGHEYRVRNEGLNEHTKIAKDNYGNDVAQAIKSPCGEYWFFEEIEGGKNADQYHENDTMFEGRSVEERLVQWYAAVTS